MNRAARTLEKRRGVLLITAAAVLVAGLIAVVSLVSAPTVHDAGRAPAATAAAIPEPETAQMEAPVRRRLLGARRAIEERPDSAALWGAYGVLCDAHGLYACAEISYARATELAPQDFRWFYLLAFTAELNGAPIDRVVRNYRTAAQLEARLPTTFFRLGDALTRAGRLDDAAAAYERALQIDPNLAVAHRGLGQVALGQGRPADAISSLLRAIDLGAAQNRATLVSLAQAQMQGGDPAAADATAKRATQPNVELAVPDPVRLRVRDASLSSQACNRRAVQLIDAGRFEEALVQMFIVEESRPDEASTHYRIGLSLARLGRLDEALPRLESAARLAPENEIVRRELERARERAR